MIDTLTRPSPLSWSDAEKAIAPVTVQRRHWCSHGTNNGKPVWKMVHGDYRARVNVGFEPDSKWSGVVNEARGKMHFDTAGEAQAWCERYILDDINRRLREAEKALSLFSLYRDHPVAGIDPDHPEYLEFEVVQNYGSEFQETMLGEVPTTRMADAWINNNGLRNAEGVEIVGVRPDGTRSEKL